MDHEHTVLTNNLHDQSEDCLGHRSKKRHSELVSLLKYLPRDNIHNKRSLSLSSVPLFIRYKLKKLHKFVLMAGLIMHILIDELKWEESSKLK